MKLLCPECERLITLEQLRLEGSTVVITCQKCGAEQRVESATAASEVAAPRVASAAPRVSLASTGGASNVVMLRTSSVEAVQKAAVAAEEDPFAIPEGVCPKCIARRAKAEACPHCGIRFAAFDEAAMLPPKWLREEWTDVLRDWSADEKHAQVRRKAQQVDALAAVGRLYRLRQAAVPEDPVAAEGLADVLRLAAVPIGLPREREDDVERRRKVVLVSVAALVLAVMVITVLRLFVAD